MLTPPTLAPMISQGPERAGPAAPGPLASSVAVSRRTPMRLVNQLEFGTSPRAFTFQAGPSSPAIHRAGSRPGRWDAAASPAARW